ncbi:hypothetical protein ONZ45_g7250 [Pleurotus djamor]|nr:hypothetical protein ONZ45_g7250 [Pleurotus djamor]
MDPTPSETGAGYDISVHPFAEAGLGDIHPMACIATLRMLGEEQALEKDSDEHGVKKMMKIKTTKEPNRDHIMHTVPHQRRIILFLVVNLNAAVDTFKAMAFVQIRVDAGCAYGIGPTDAPATRCFSVP